MIKQKQHFSLWGFIAVVLAVIVTSATSWYLYTYTVDLLTVNLRERLITIATTTSVSIAAKDVEALKVKDDWEKPEWSRVVKQLKRVRETNKDIIFIYIFRKKLDDPSQFEFVADSHSLNPFVNLDEDPSNDVDVDKNGVIDDVDVLQWPGQEYPEPPMDAAEAYYGPTSNKELYTDSWGTYFTGYSPIKNDAGDVVAILAVDVKADEFFTITGQTLLPFLFFIIFLILVLVVLSAGIITIWNKRVDFLAELDRQKDELLGIVAHQLAKPITAISWDLESFLDGDLGQLNDVQKTEVKTMRAQAINLADLVSMILDVSRIQLGKMSFQPQPLDLNVCFKEILEIVEPFVKEKDINFVKNIPSRLPTVLLDKRFTRMTVENLLTNAVKYTPKYGTVTMNLEIIKDSLFFSVSDTGCGIPKKEQEKIFGKMYRASNVRNTVDGNGFGLYVAKGAVEGQGGKIWFRSVEGKGTTFAFELPLKEVEATDKKA